MFSIVRRDRLAKAGKAECIRITYAAIGKGGACGLTHDLGRRIGRLADRHRDDVMALRFQPIRLGEHVHGVKGFDAASP
jgi:hypothetical protein